ncbi:hypothetical protein BD324DRAFT_650411 [Kockovaella imperatae]|uniref:ATP-dependent DNA ligase family profile domain-containing protein n=1 Tax=Kockovaella imperatae TaxID=4999 RepID=A0A1Y1UIJ4_9TREE|nr:hypothetical protein BD324DRAFT_650411 [Kockovaella imperatae]ORX37868.1 hypothetical protein BD324DRAFT_650411 [Kockovaella imperatae]
MDITFESFAKLIYRLSHPPQARSRENRTFTPADIFTSWLNHLDRPLPPGSGKHVLRILFPHEGCRRRYGMKEMKLACELERILRIKGLSRWDSAGSPGGGSGCLGLEVQRVCKERTTSRVSSLTLAEIDLRLDQLASYSPFSQLEVPPCDPPSQTDILSHLFRDSNLSSYASGLLIQIILQDIRPFLDPLPKLALRNATSLLRMKSTHGPPQLDLLSAMRAWDPRMADMFVDGKGDLDWCADMAEAMRSWDGEEPLSLDECVFAGPVIGVNVQIPKCLKGRSVEAVLDSFCRKRYGPAVGTIWAETKYDGYRMQIHVEVKSDNDIRITIFSKSKRNATIDRIHTHSIILAALGLPIHHALPQHPRLRSVILEAEVIPYNEGHRQGGRGPGIEEFWWLGSAGVTGGEENGDPHAEGPLDPNRHLCLAFFDILHLDGHSLLTEDYERRRQLLESVLQPIEGFASLAERTAIDLGVGRSVALQALQVVFDKCNETRCEGLVIKAGRSSYMDPRWRWVKLKKDYIPNLGDCIDLVLLGAGWDPDRARGLRVDTSVLTTFYIGVLTNHEKVKSRLESPHFEILFPVSYGLDRDALEMVNSKIRLGSWRTKPYDKDDPFKRRLIGLSWTYRMPRGIKTPSILFEKPLCAEIMGAGFLKLPSSQLYELRFPRLQKIFDPSERSYADALTSTALIAAAHQSLGYSSGTVNPHPSPQDDSIRALWRSASAKTLTDITEFPTPSPERPSPRRMQSAPQLPTFKPSPRTPSPRSRQPQESSPIFGLPSAHQLANALTTDTTSFQQRSFVSPESEDVECAMPFGSVTQTLNGLKRLGSPIAATPPKAAKHQHSPLRPTSHVFTPPLTSPVLGPKPSLQLAASGSPSRSILRNLEVNSNLRNAPRSASKALSLRSRIRIALQGGR